MDNDLLCPAIILIPVKHSYRIIALIWPVDCTHNISSDVTISEHTFHPVFPLMPVLIHQMVMISNLVVVQIFLCLDQVNGSIITCTKL